MSSPYDRGFEYGYLGWRPPAAGAAPRKRNARLLVRGWRDGRRARRVKAEIDRARVGVAS